VRKSSKSLRGIKLYIVESIHKRLNIISQAWEVSSSLRDFSQRITTFMEYLKKDLEHDESFYKKSLSTFNAWVSSLNDYHRNQQNLPSNNRIKQLKLGWMTTIQKL
jgi:hypothetical protein